LAGEPLLEVLSLLREDLDGSFFDGSLLEGSLLLGYALDGSLLLGSLFDGSLLEGLLLLGSLFDGSLLEGLLLLGEALDGSLLEGLLLLGGSLMFGGFCVGGSLLDGSVTFGFGGLTCCEFDYCGSCWPPDPEFALGSELWPGSTGSAGAFADFEGSLGMFFEAGVGVAGRCAGDRVDAGAAGVGDDIMGTMAVALFSVVGGS